VVAAASAIAAVIGAVAVAADPTPEFHPIATALGEAWADELVRLLRADKRKVIGAWPGTMSEARMRVLARLHRKLDVAVLDDLARVTIGAARREWHQVSQPDPEP
jgi:hypothetical protein